VTVYTPRTLEQALRIRAQHPDARPIHGGTDVMVEVNFGRAADETFLDLSAVDELRGWCRDAETLVLGAGMRFVDVIAEPAGRMLPALAEAARTVGSPQIRNRGTLGGNLATASPAGDALPPLLMADAQLELASMAGRRRLALGDFLLGPKRTALAADELIVGVRVPRSRAPETFMKIGPRNAMVISVASLALAVDRERGRLRAAYGSAGPTVARVEAPLDDAARFPELVATACSPIDDVRGTARYRRHALSVLTARALQRCGA
jgi:CO/xanthine dehydrogenase FAD-binding subunit